MAPIKHNLNFRIYPATLIADFFLSHSDEEAGEVLSNLKVQKLCYYAAGVASAARREAASPLFNEKIEAWQHGPVVVDLYHRFKTFGSNPIPRPNRTNFDEIETRDQKILCDVYEYYGQYSAWKLRNMTHEESPWLHAFNRHDKTIKIHELMEFFSEEFVEEYLESYLLH
ncbi:Panacea domain-containing protein (plasmid) [Leisingera aquaemixtae]|uniref:Panacea domain-containing protein n=1 Tax=Leisingera aquaemixtae TaxID=1396826 RepID=UPI003983E299